MASSNEALRWVSYPTAVLAKSSKLIPTMAVGVLVNRRPYSAREWVGAALITAGIVAFNLSRMADASGADGPRSDSPYGLALLLFSLAMDGLLSSAQGALKQTNDDEPGGSGRVARAYHRPPDAIETMLFINVYACIFLLPTSLYTGQFGNGMRLLGAPNGGGTEAFRGMVFLNLTAAAGQVFIFMTIHLFSPLMCTTITTTRKFFTILLSVIHFGHVFTAVQWASIGMVFGGLYLEISAKIGSSRRIGGEKRD